MHQPEPELPALTPRLTLDDPRLEQRGEHPRDRARVDLGPPRELVRARRRARSGQRLEQRDRALDRAERSAHGDRPGGRSTLSTPPSITTVVPVTQSPAGEARYAIISRSPRRCPAVRCGMVAATSSTRVAVPAPAFVSIVPGATHVEPRAAPAPRRRERARHRFHGRSRRRGVEHPRHAAPRREHHADDLAVPARQHALHGREARQLPDRVEVDAHDRAKAVVAHLLRRRHELPSGVVDQHVQRAVRPR